MLKDGTQPLDPRLDRLRQFDERSRNYPIRATLTAAQQLKPRSYTWDVGAWLDQGTEGACVGFAFAHELNARPMRVAGIDDKYARERIYWEAQRIDPWPGGAYPGASTFYEGTSVLAGAQTVHRAGYMDSYHWAFGLDDLRLAVGYKGPAVIGVDWYSGMFDPDKAGYLRPTGQYAGGHAIVVYQNSERDQRFGVWNSWGKGWGRDGTAYISHEDMDFLLNQQGEACIPLGRKGGRNADRGGGKFLKK